MGSVSKELETESVMKTMNRLTEDVQSVIDGMDIDDVSIRTIDISTRRHHVRAVIELEGVDSELKMTQVAVQADENGDIDEIKYEYRPVYLSELSLYYKI